MRVAWAPDFADAPSRAADEPMPRSPNGLPPDWSALAEGLAGPKDPGCDQAPSGRLHGTEHDLQRRRRDVGTAVVGGIATDFGVEQTAREARQHGYDDVVLDDFCASVSIELHEASILHVLPRIASVRRVDDPRLAAR